MSDQQEAGDGRPDEIAEPVIAERGGPSIIWLIPVVAILVGGYLAIDAYRNRGFEIIIELPSAEWVEAGKTKIRYLSVEAGSVTGIELKDDLSGVELRCTLHRSAKKHITEGTQFWIVHPRVGAGGVSGLGTLLSGAYIALRPGPPGGKLQHRFEGLDLPPPEPSDAPGLRIELHAAALESLDAGSPVYYREFQVGKVEGRRLEEDGSAVVLSLYIESEHADLVRRDSRFWDAGGVEVSGTLANLDVEMESLDAILSGGIAFDSPSGTRAKPAENGASFWLHPSRNDVATYAFRYGGLRIHLEGEHLGSVATGDWVYYRETRVGAVVSQELSKDSRHIRLVLNIQPRYATLVRSNSVFWNASGISANLGLHGLEIHAESLSSIVAGGVAFATPDKPGHEVESGSVFRMHPELEEKWLEWDPVLWRGKPEEAPRATKDAAKSPGKKTHGPRFFHHKGKQREEATAAGEPAKDAAQASAQDEKRHGFFGRLFGKDEQEDD